MDYFQESLQQPWMARSFDSWISRDEWGWRSGFLARTFRQPAIQLSCLLILE